MDEFLRIMAWNANGLNNHLNELQIVLDTEKIDICLSSETHLVTQSKSKNYKSYHTVNPDNCARGGSAIIIRNSIDHYEEEKISSLKFQTTTVTVKTKNQPLSITAVYSPPKHSISSNEYELLIKMHKSKFIMGGDFNAKHTYWGSRLTTTKRRELYDAAKKTGCEFVSTGKPTYWPTDVNKIPDLVDFFVINKLSRNFIQVQEGLHLDSDLSPIYLTLSETVIVKEENPYLSNKIELVLNIS